MLRFLSSYLFQNENAPEPNEDPTTIPDEHKQQGPNTRSKEERDNDSSTADFMDFTEHEEKPDDDEQDDDDDDEDDWVLIGGGGGEKPTVSTDGGEQPATLVAPNDDDDDDDQKGCDDDEERPALPHDQEQEEDQAQFQEQGLLWENKLIEHPSMSVYIDLATSLNTGVTSCMSLSSIAPANSPGESVIVLEDHEEDDDEENMDILDSVELLEPEVLKQKSDTACTNAIAPKSKSASSSPPTAAPPLPAPQNGRRKKGHYPCSSNTSNMPRRHLRSGASTRQTFQMIANSPTWGSPAPGASLPDLQNNNHDVSKKKRANGPSSGATTTVSTCGIAIVGQGPATSLGNNNSMLNKNLCCDLFPTAAKNRKPYPSKHVSSPKGHYLQESRRRSDLQNYTRHSHVNNDRRSAQQRRLPKNPNNGGASGGRK